VRQRRGFSRAVSAASAKLQQANAMAPSVSRGRAWHAAGSRQTALAVSLATSRGGVHDCARAALNNIVGVGRMALGARVSVSSHTRQHSKRLAWRNGGIRRCRGTARGIAAAAATT